MKTIPSLGLWLGLASMLQAQQVVKEIDWRQLSERGELRGRVSATIDGRSALQLVNTNNTPLLVKLVEITSPGITGMRYELGGEIKYEQVVGDGYLEMWNYFPPAKPGLPESQYFSRTLGSSGAMGKITGTSDWRKFALPFDRTGSTHPPTRLEVNLFLPGPGRVYVGGLSLLEYSGAGGGFESVGYGSGRAWWSDRTAGLAGGVAGALIGCLAGLLGWLASVSRARGFVLVTSRVLIWLGGGLAVLGIVALGVGQPFGVWFPLLLLGVMLLSILPVRLRQFARQYESAELRKMAALDAMKS